MPSAVVASAIVLRAVPYGEADRVVSLLCLPGGRISALARNARRSQRRFGGGLGLGSFGTATLSERTGADLAHLESFETQNAHLGLGADLGRTAHAAYALELCERLCASHQEETAAFHWLHRILGVLDQREATAERLRIFELGLLKRLGLAPVLAGCAICQRPLAPGERARWQPERGGTVCWGCAGRGTIVTPEVAAALRMVEGAALEDAEALLLPREVNAACRRLIQELLQLHIPGTLKSMEFMEKLAGTR